MTRRASCLSRKARHLIRARARSNACGVDVHDPQSMTRAQPFAAPPPRFDQTGPPAPCRADALGKKPLLSVDPTHAHAGEGMAPRAGSPENFGGQSSHWGGENAEPQCGSISELQRVRGHSGVLSTAGSTAGSAAFAVSAGMSAGMSAKWFLNASMTDSVGTSTRWFGSLESNS